MKVYSLNFKYCVFFFLVFILFIVSFFSLFFPYISFFFFFRWITFILQMSSFKYSHFHFNCHKGLFSFLSFIPSSPFPLSLFPLILPPLPLSSLSLLSLSLFLPPPLSSLPPGCPRPKSRNIFYGFLFQRKSRKK